MSEELRPCPFCGGEAQVNTWTLHGITESRCFCTNSDCPNSVRTIALEQWNTRPIEDALNARIAARDALIERLIDVAQKKFATYLPMNEQAITWGGKWMKLKTEWQAMKGEKE